MQTLVVPFGHANTQRSCDVLAHQPGSSEVELDLSALEFVGPLFLVRLRAWLDAHDAAGTSVTVVPPNKNEVQRYMSRMHIHHDLGDNVSFSLPEVHENDRGDRLIPVTRLEAAGQNDFDDLLGGLLDSADMTGARYLAEVVEETAQEMANNAVSHGENPIGAYVAAQRFYSPKSAAPLRCVFAAGDLGVGMAAHLRQGGQGKPSDAQTIAHGLTDMVTGTGEQWRGRGYSVPFEMAVQKSAYVRLRVRANQGWVEKRNADLPRPISASSPDAGAGTWVEFEFGHADK